MSWNFLYIKRLSFQSSNNWGVLYIMTSNNTWEKLCYSYELPWSTYESGPLKNKSKNNLSRIKIGDYYLKPRAGGPKGWRLELQGTGHRKNIQIHRAHKSMFIEGCILPVHFNNFTKSNLSKGDAVIQTQSVTLMKVIKERYELLSKDNAGKALLCISAILPARIENTALAKA